MSKLLKRHAVSLPKI